MKVVHKYYLLFLIYMMNILEYINGSDIPDLKNKLVDIINNTDDDKLLRQIDSVVWSRNESSISEIKKVAEDKLIDKYIKTIINTVLGNGDNLQDFSDIIKEGYLTIDEVIENINNFTSKIPLIDLVFNKIQIKNKDISRETLIDLANLKFNGMGRFELFLALFTKGAERPKQGADVVVNGIKFELKDHTGILKGRGKYNVDINAINDFNKRINGKFNFPIKNNTDFKMFINYIKSADDNKVKNEIADDIVKIYISSWDAYPSVFQEKYKEGFKNFLLNIHNTTTAHQDFMKWVSYYMLYSYCYNKDGDATFDYLLITAAGDNGEYKLLKMPAEIGNDIFDNITNIINKCGLEFAKYPRLERDSSHNIEISFKPNENTNRTRK